MNVNEIGVGVSIAAILAGRASILVLASTDTPLFLIYVMIDDFAVYILLISL